MPNLADLPPGQDTDFGQLWSEAIRRFNERTADHDARLLKGELSTALKRCTTTSVIMDTLEAEMGRFDGFRAADSKWGRLRNDLLKPAVDVILLITETAGELASSFVSLLLCLAAHFLSSIRSLSPAEKPFSLLLVSCLRYVLVDAICAYWNVRHLFIGHKRCQQALRRAHRALRGSKPVPRPACCPP
jgi:hypothetical protein